MATKADASPTNHKKPCGLWLVAMVIHSNRCIECGEHSNSEMGEVLTLTC